MKCKYCDQIFVENADTVLNYFNHVQINHYDTLTDDDKIMHDIRDKMIKSKKEFEILKKKIGDSDLIFNQKYLDV
ncbi:MAG: hypothetical protein HOE93_00400 [Nitrosopumilus sp.]|nr:hypothetical protein [Nitrosopumilus sp.]MBT3955762.1 hypothetical protein [Nitrosopumilus sp.]MBT6194718.1 hypothetical protein [Nitrosopumilus sp.]MBT6838795.1 hypothetical protein [Nitrosopumilus sp.]MBT7920431.1 hypothetical protein [Nitrosopumilus sp.]